MTLCVMPFLAMRVSEAGEEARPAFRSKPRPRAVTVSGRVEEARVAARTATRSRFDTAVGAVRTHPEDGRGRFEPPPPGHGFLVITAREELSESGRVTLPVVPAEGRLAEAMWRRGPGRPVGVEYVERMGNRRWRCRPSASSPGPCLETDRPGSSWSCVGGVEPVWRHQRASRCERP